MARLIYTAISSLDGYIADEEGRFDWSEPDEEVHRFVNELVRPVGTYLLGRRMYEVMRVWDTLELDDLPQHISDFARIWREADKIVYSTTLDHVAAPRTRLERDFAVDAIRRLKEEAPSDLAVGGAALAAHAFEAGLVDVVQLFLSPVIVGGGTRCLPAGVRARLELEDERRFANGVVYLGYRAGGDSG